MHTLIKTTFAAGAAMATLVLTAPAIAQDEQIVVESAAAMEAWTDVTERSLNRKLIGSERAMRVKPKSGIVQLRFTLDEEGRADNFKVYSSSGNNRTDKVAKRAVQSLSNLAEVPVRNARAQTFQANIIFANSEREHEELATILAKREAKRIAMGGSETTVVAFGG